MKIKDISSTEIPILSITGTNGKTTVTRLIGYILAETGKTVGMTTTDGIWIGRECIERGDTTGPRSARKILSNSAVEVAVLETARGGIMRSGLGYEWSDISVITNIQPDHIGQDGIESIEDILRVKSIVAERVREGGTLVLNADDELLSNLPKSLATRSIKRQIAYFSLKPDNPIIKAHLASGSAAYFPKDGWIVEAVGRKEIRIAEVSAIPITLGGIAQFQIANICASVAACRAFGVQAEKIAGSLIKFQNDVDNPGRSNLYQIKSGYVMLDYGHNPEAFNAICRMVSDWPCKVTGIIGVPGDRANHLIEQAGRAAARGFHKILVREDEDLRGRKHGETAQLLYRSIKDEAPGKECLIVLNACKALSLAIRDMVRGELVVIFYEKLLPLQDLLKRYEAKPLSSIEGLARAKTE
jgi:cyanophycin synthetase